MSTASPLPLQPLPDAVVSAHEQEQLRREVAARLQQHRRRRPARGNDHPYFPDMDASTPLSRALSTQGSRVADSVAARFAAKASYRDLLTQEAEVATRQAEAAAEVARRNAEAVAHAQQRLLDDIAHWNASDTSSVMHGAEEVSAHVDSTVVLTEVLSFAEPVLTQTTQQFTAMPQAVGTASTADIFVANAAANAERQPQARVETAFTAVFAEAMTASAASTGTLLFDSSTEAVHEPMELPTGLPTNLIEFPRQLVAARKARPRLAEGPLREDPSAAPERAQLRIFEVEADTFSTVPMAVTESILPEWSSIRLDSWQPPHETASPDSQVSNALPLYTAPVEARCMAAAVDACCIGATFLLAVAVACYASPELPTGLMAVAAAGGSLTLLTVFYLALFFTLTEATPGMRYARIALCTFNDDNPTRPAMRRRLLAMLLSLLPLGLGFLWALLDDDRLSWHDRISRMYQRAY